MSSQTDAFVAPRHPVGRGRKPKKKRRSSILKTTKTLEEIQNLSQNDERAQKDRRVSFCTMVEIKEFHDQPRKTGRSVSQGEETQPLLETGGEVKKVELPSEDDSFIQMSTPLRKKRRRISSHSGAKIERFSIIPSMERSFIFREDDVDFEAYDEEATVAARGDITMTEEGPEPPQGVSVTDDDFSGGGEKPVEATCLPNSTTDAGQECSDMEMTVMNDSYTSEPADKLRPSKPVEGSFQEFWKELQNVPKSPDASTTAIADPRATHDSRLTCIDPPLATSTDAHSGQPPKPDAVLFDAHMQSNVSDLKITCVESLLPECQADPVTHPKNTDEKSTLQTARRSTCNMSFTCMPTPSLVWLSQGGSQTSMSLTCMGQQSDCIPGVTESLVASEKTCQPDNVPQYCGTKSSASVPSTESRMSLESQHSQFSDKPQAIGSEQSERAGESQIQFTRVEPLPSAATQWAKLSSVPDNLLSPTHKSLPSSAMDSESQTCIEPTPGSNGQQELDDDGSRQNEGLGCQPEDHQQGSPVPSCGRATATPLTASKPTPGNARTSPSDPNPNEGHFQEPLFRPLHRLPSTTAVRNGSTSKPLVLAAPAGPPLATTPMLVGNLTHLRGAGNTSLTPFTSVYSSLLSSTTRLRPAAGGPTTGIAQNATLRTGGAATTGGELRFGGENTFGAVSQLSSPMLTCSSSPEVDISHTSLGHTDCNPNATVTLGPKPSDPDTSSLVDACSDSQVSGILEMDLTDVTAPSNPPKGSFGDAATPVGTHPVSTGASWLNDDSFSLVISSPDSEHSSTEPTGQSPCLPAPSIPQNQSSRPGFARTGAPCGPGGPPSQEMAEIRETLHTLRANTHSCNNDTLQVSTPEAVKVDRTGRKRAALLPPTPPTTLEASMMSRSLPMGQSVLMSPSAFNKFLGQIKDLDDTTLVYRDTEHISASSVGPPPTAPQLVLTPSHTEKPCSTQTPSSCGLADGDDKPQSIPGTPYHFPTQDAELSAIHDSLSFTLGESAAPSKEYRLGVSSGTLEFPTAADEMTTETPAESSTGQCHGAGRADEEEDWVPLSLKPFGAHLQEVYSRIMSAVEAVEKRLAIPDYTNCDPRIRQALETWTAASQTLLVNLGLLLKFGQLSGLAQSQKWDDSGLQQLPSVPDSLEDIGGNVGRKADWIWEMIQTVESLQEVVEATAGEAARLFPWELVEWSISDLEICIPRRLTLTFQLGPCEATDHKTIRRVDASHMKIEDGGVLDLGGIDECSDTDNLAEVLWKLTQKDVDYQ